MDHHILCSCRIILQNKYHATRSHIGSSFLVVFVHSDVAICCSFKLYFLTILRHTSGGNTKFLCYPPLLVLTNSFVHLFSFQYFYLSFQLFDEMSIKISIQWFPRTRFLLNYCQALKYHKKNQNVAQECCFHWFF